MAVHFDTKLEINLPGAVTAAAWHNVLPIVCLSKNVPGEGGQLLFYNDDGDLSKESTWKRGKVIASFAWHPTKRVVAIGTQDGDLYCYNEEEKRTYDFPNAHRVPLTILRFTRDGLKLVSGDANGYMFIWKLDVRGKPQQNPAAQHCVNAPIQHILMRTVAVTQVGYIDLMQLAKMAVSGDENALDLLSWNPLMKGMNVFAVMPQSEGYAFFVVNGAGAVYYLSEDNKLRQLFKSDTQIRRMLFYEKRNILVTLTHAFMLIQHTINSDGQAKEISRVKLGSKSDYADLIWGPPGTLIASCGEDVLRVFDLDRDATYSLQLDSTQITQIERHFNTELFDPNKHGKAPADPAVTTSLLANVTVSTSRADKSKVAFSARNMVFTAVSYASRKQTLAACTNLGVVAFWKFSQQVREKSKQSIIDFDYATQWRSEPCSLLHPTEVIRCEFGAKAELLVAVNKQDEVFVLMEQSMTVAYCAQRLAAQSGPYTLTLANFTSRDEAPRQLGSALVNTTEISLTSGIQIRGAFLTRDNLLVWDGKRLVVHELPAETNGFEFRESSSFTIESLSCVAFEQSVFTTDDRKVQVRSLQGTVKQLLDFSESEGSPTILDMSGIFLAVATTRGYVKIFDVSRREAKQIGASKHVAPMIPQFGYISQMKVNCAGNKFALLVATEDNVVLPKLYILDMEQDTIHYFNFESGLSEAEDYAITKAAEVNKTLSGKSLPDSQKDKRASDSLNERVSKSKDSSSGSGGSQKTAQQGSVGKTGSSGSVFELANHVPISLFWDATEPRLLVCEVHPMSETHKRALRPKAAKTNKNKAGSQPSTSKKLAGASGQRLTRTDAEDYDILDAAEAEPDTSEDSKKGDSSVYLVSLLVSVDDGVLLHDAFPLANESGDMKLVAIETPYYYFLTRDSVEAAAKKEAEALQSAATPMKTTVLVSGRQTEVEQVKIPLVSPVIKPSDSELRNDAATADVNSLHSRARANQAIQRLGNMARKTMRDWVGLENAVDNKSLRDSVLNFSYCLTVGNMDEALKVMSSVRGFMMNSSRMKRETVWFNLAKMCIKTRRIDIALMCLGSLGNARAVKALRECVRTEPENIEVQIAMLSIQLGFIEEAEAIYRKIERYDLLIRLYQTMGEFQKAIEIAEKHDRINLRSVYFDYARHLESLGDTSGAITYYMKTDSYRSEIPRLLYQINPAKLEEFVHSQKDAVLQRWWAQYLESIGEFDVARNFYEACGDHRSVVNLLCSRGNIKRAIEICTDTNQPAACYYLARHFEQANQVDQALSFYIRAQAYAQAARLCRELERDDQLMNVAIRARPDDQLDAARYFEKRNGCIDKAIVLYHKAGHLSKAIQLAFDSHQFDALQLVSYDLNERSDPEILQRCAQFFVENGQFDRAVELLANAKQFSRAITICADHNVQMTEPLIEKLTDFSSATDSSLPIDERNRIMEQAADVAMQQGQYHLATKKYTQIGNKAKAMRALIKSNDTEKVIFFANTARQKDIYVMAANYLQTTDWQHNLELLKSIVGFYTKARAFESLASFYIGCAQMEIDEFGNYEKAYAALGEAYKLLSNAAEKQSDGEVRASSTDALSFMGGSGVTNRTTLQKRIQQLEEQINLVRSFAEARKAASHDIGDALRKCHALIKEIEDSQAGGESLIKQVHVFAFLFEVFVRQESWKQAHSCFETMLQRCPRREVEKFVDLKAAERAYAQVGETFTFGAAKQERRKPETPNVDRNTASNRDSNGGGQFRVGGNDDDEITEGAIVDEAVDDD